VARDESIQSLWQAVNDDRLARSTTTAKALATKTKLRTGVPHTARTLWALSAPELYVMQIDGGGLTPGRYERWLGDLLIAAILPS